MKCWEWQDRRGNGAWTEWYAKLDDKSQALLDTKLDMLHNAEKTEDLPELVGPIKSGGRKYKSILKFRIGRKRSLRPLFCRGPADLKKELTCLIGAEEINGKFKPKNAPDKALVRREEIEHDHTARKLIQQE